MAKIRSGDEVIIIAGKDKNRKGVVKTVLQSGEYLLVEGINTVKKHTKPNPDAGDQGGVITKEMPIHSSNVKYFDQSSGKGTRVGIRVRDDGQKVRFSKVSQEVIDV